MLEKEYPIEDIIEITGLTKEQAVTLLKAEPLTASEVNQYGGVGTDDNHVNRYTNESKGISYDKNGYGGMAYYTSETCGFVNENRVIDGCTTDYAQSEVKYVVDSWKTTNAPQATEARLISYEELISELECTSDNCSNSSYSWLYNSNYDYWTSTSSSYDPTTSMRVVSTNGGLYFQVVNFHIGGYGGNSVVRPVIVLPKSSLQ